MNGHEPIEGERREPRFVVGIGASAGGVEALERLFARMPSDTGMTFVVVQHLSPDFKSLMDELLARWTTMPVHRVTDGVAVEPNAIYLIPPKKEMIISEGRLLLTDKEPGQGLALPIDLFFRSLAQDLGRRAVAVVLSGTGSDGSRGIEEIHAAGGLTIAQDESTAKFVGMPRSAHETGTVDLVLPPEDIPQALVDYAGRPDEIRTSGLDAVADIQGLPAVFRVIRTAHGIDFSHYKLNTVVRRLERRMQMSGLGNLSEYVARLSEDTVEVDALYHDLLIGVTRFLRDEDAFHELVNALDEMITRLEDGADFRAWVAGCATGEEAYTIAILVHERARLMDKKLNLRIFATDVHKASLEKASEGVYSKDAVSLLPQEWLDRYFQETPRGYVVSQTIRPSVVFAHHDVVKGPPFTRLDLVTCRNLLIYLQPAALKKALSLFHFGLKTGGLLFLGPSESVGDLENEFDPVHRRSKIFRKRRDIRLPLDTRLNFGPTGPESIMPRTGVAPRGPDTHLIGAYDALLEEYVPPGLLISDRHELIHVFGDAGRYLIQPSGRVSPNVLDRMSSDLRMVVTAAIQQALARGKSVHYNSVPAHSDLGQEKIHVTVKPVVNRRERGTDLLVLLRPAVTAGVTAAAPPESNTGIEYVSLEPGRIGSLESELQHTRENLQATVEELETSNEELQASNEELVASNEELQSTNEELHSVNEELYTVNAEHQRKIDELSELTRDMDNLLQSTRVYLVFLDSELRIRKFTPSIAEVFSLRPEDEGRSIADFSHKLQRSNLVDDLHQVLVSGDAVEAEVQDINGKWFFLRVLPYLANGKRVGVVLTLIDIEPLKKVREELADRERWLRLIMDNVPSLISYLGPDLRFQFANRRYADVFGKPINDTGSSHLREVIGEQPFERARPYLERALSGEQVTYEKRARDVQSHQFNGIVTYVPDRDPNGEVIGLFACIQNVTELKQSEQRFRRAVEGTVDGIWEWELGSDRTYFSARFAHLLGFGNGQYKETFGDFLSRAHPDDIGHLRSAMQAHLLDADRPFHEEVRLRRQDGQYRWFRVSGVAERDESDHAVRLTGSIQDVSARREMVEQLREQIRQREIFLATLSHELRNPLAAVLNASHVLEREDQDSAHRAQAIGVIQRQSGQMADLLADLLDLSRGLGGRIELKRSVVDLREPIDMAVEALRPRAEKLEQELTVDLPSEPIRVDGDPVRLRQICSNLLANACKYTPARGRIELKLERGSTGGRDEAIIRVRDTGAGIEPGMQDRIFEPFVQLGQTLDRSDGGLGVGLTLTKTLTDLHRGRIEVFSEGNGKGSEFVVRLPLFEGTEPSSNGRELQRAPVRRVAVVEDGADARDMLCRLLNIHGFEVCDAADGSAGLELIRRWKPDVALVDVGLPELNGYEVAEAVRGESALNDVRLIALTGYGQASDRQKSAEAGFERHLMKPLNWPELLRLLED